MEKEAYPIVRATVELEYSHGRKIVFRLHYDHADLIRIFQPAAKLKQHAHGKLHC